jgi:hypothetical protein
VTEIKLSGEELRKYYHDEKMKIEVQHAENLEKLYHLYSQELKRLNLICFGDDEGRIPYDDEQIGYDWLKEEIK